MARAEPDLGTAKGGEMPQDLVSEPTFQRAVSGLVQRAEKQDDAERLVATFVDPGIVVQLTNKNDQILYGRRGTGKTHVLKVIQRDFASTSRSHAVYVDLRRLGDTEVFKDADRPIEVRVASLLRAVVEAVSADIVTVSGASGSPARVIDAEKQVSDVLSAWSLDEEQVTIEEGESRERTRAGEARVKVAAKPELGLTGGSQQKLSDSEKIVRAGRRVERIDFAKLDGAFSTLLETAQIDQLLILLDEWTPGVPRDLQPLLAEFLKRSVVPSSRVAVKIASVEYRANFSLPLGHNNALGFQLGADIATALEMDDYLVYDRNPDRTCSFFAELLYRHLAVEIGVGRVKELFDEATPDKPSGWLRNLRRVLTTGGEQGVTSSGPANDPVASLLEFVGSHAWGTDYMDRVGASYMMTSFGVGTAKQLTGTLFTKGTFGELVRASEGVVRDFINVFVKSFFAAQRTGKNRVDKLSVRTAARDWYLSDKAANLNEEEDRVLQYLVTELIRDKKARTFLLEPNAEEVDSIRSLVDLRVLHPVRRGFADPSDPAKTYGIYSLDFGSYVHLAGGQNAPAADFNEEEKLREGFVVPFDDHRTIRKIILSRDDLLSAIAAPAGGPGSASDDDPSG